MQLYLATQPGMVQVRRHRAAVIGWIIFAVAAAIFAFAAIQILGIVSEDVEAGQTTAAMQAYTSGTPDAFLSISGVTEQAAPQSAEEGFRVDFAGLTQSAPDTRAWIRVPGTNVNHPVMQGKDNNEYLRRGPDGSANRSGSIFMDYRCSKDFTDRNTILYGHRMNNNTMFAQLHNYEDKDFRATHPYIYINLPDGTALTYRVFAVYQPGNLLSGHPYQVAWMSDDDFIRWCGEDRLRPFFFDSSQQFSPEDRIITLSTCVRNDGSKRFIVQGRLISHTTQETAPQAA